MPRPYASTVIDAPADEVWAVIRDFDSLPVWNSDAVARGEIEDGRAGDQVGSTRAIWLADGTDIRAQLASHSDAERSYSYSSLQSPFDLENYFATMRVTPVTDGDRSF